MKVSELFEAAYEETFKDYIERLKSMGLNPVGNGLNSVVFEHPTMPHVAVKIFMDDDLGYREYLEFCLSHPRNKYVPRIFETDDFSSERRTKYFTKELHANWNVSRSVNEPYSIAFIEMLKPVTVEAMEAMINRLANIAGLDEINSLAKLGPTGWATIAEDEHDKDLQEFAKFLVSQVKVGHKLDMGNRKNFCLRGDQFVFIDPFF